jgi:poly-gamma-glutamate capsule biosynthesis protein CapA/YwtB (metallophosphatase superfamily)
MVHPGEGRSLKLILAGDAMLGRGVNEMIHRHGFEYPLEPLLPVLRTSDLIFFNLECAISPQDILFSGDIKMFYFRADPVAADTLFYAGVDLVSLANNHALDADYAGLMDTMDILNGKEIASVGAGEKNAAASRPAILQNNGLRVGVLAYCDHQADFQATVDLPGIRYVDIFDRRSVDQLIEEVVDLASQVDIPVVSFHWQPNWEPHIHRVYRSLAQRIIEAGALIIWGHSPHHFQGVEWLDNRVVIYSSGGLVDDYALDPEYRNDRQLLFLVEVSDKGVDRLLAYPIELDFARTYPASGEPKRWIEERFSQMCTEVGSRIEKWDEWLEVLPIGAIDGLR